MQAYQTNVDPNILQALKSNEEERRQAHSLFESQDMVKMINAYTEERIDEQLKKDPLIKQFFGIFGKAPVLTFIDKEDEEDFDSLFRLSKLIYLRSVPGREFKIENIQLLNQIRIYFKSAIKRSIGFDKNKQNERSLQATMINQIVRSNTENYELPAKQGMFKKLTNWA